MIMLDSCMLLNDQCPQSNDQFNITTTREPSTIESLNGTVTIVNDFNVTYDNETLDNSTDIFEFDNESTVSINTNMFNKNNASLVDDNSPTEDRVKIKCDRGKKWNSKLHVCVEMLISCPKGLILHPISMKCVTIEKAPLNCSSGFEYNQFYKICKDVDECTEKSHNCTRYKEICVNTNGSFDCQCESGFERSINGKCVDIDECLNRSACPDNKRCHNIIGSYRCGRILPCGFGWREDIDTGLCVDVDECVIYPDICGRGMKCVNIRGSHQCEDEECPGLMKRNNRGICSMCRDGYEYDNKTKQCHDIDECTSKLGWVKGRCRESEVCVNLPGSYECYPKKKCFVGTKLSSNGTSCEDIDECKEMTFRCNEDQICMNTYSSFECIETPCAPSEIYSYNTRRCDCKEGFKMSNNGECWDIDECAEYENKCGSLYQCINQPGTFMCVMKSVCQPGTYRPSRDALCQDIDECETGEAKCPKSSYCQNVVGSYNCMCNRGYLRLENGTCADVNECLLFRPEESCPDLEARCINTPGSYTCSCPRGFKWADYPIRKCLDINECEIGKGQFQFLNPCGEGHECVNTIGSYKCNCKLGYRLKFSGLACEDIDECQLSSKKCLNGKCINTNGSYRCQCPEGFSADQNQVCQDIDECHTYNNLCSMLSNQICINLQGSYKCVKHYCQVGYKYQVTGNGFMCTLSVSDSCNDKDVVCLLRKPYRREYVYLELSRLVELPYVLTRIDTHFTSNSDSQVTMIIKQSSNIKTKLPISVRSAFRFRKNRFNNKVYELILWNRVPAPSEVVLRVQLSVYNEGNYYGHSETEIYLYFTYL